MTASAPRWTGPTPAPSPAAPAAVEERAPSPSRAASWIARAAPAAAWAASAAYVASSLLRGWMPHDEGAIGQSAERLLMGQLPHRDFAELYTGGLTFAHALAFRLLGVSLVAPRLLLFAVFLLWVPALYYVLSRFARPVPAAGLTLLAVAWSVPCYPASLPTWYNLFLATFGTAALLRYVDTGRRRWLVAAGLCGGLSILVKVVGLYFVAGALLFLAYREQEESRRAARAAREGLDPDDARDARGGRGYPLLATGALAAFAAALVGLVRHDLTGRVVVHFVVPGAALAAALIVREWMEPSPEPSRRRLGRLLGDALPFVAGVAAPVALFFGWYAAQGALGALVQGVFVLPQKRLSNASYPLPTLRSTLVPALLAAAALVTALWPRDRRAAWRVGVLLALVGTLVVMIAAWLREVYHGVWLGVWALPPMLALGGAALLARAPRESAARPDDRVRRERVALVLAVMATFTLVQFPFSAPVYYNYVTPLVVAALAAVASLRPRVQAPAGGGLVVALLLFAVALVRPGYLGGMGYVYRPELMETRLGGPRGGIRVTEGEAEENRQLLALVAAHAPPGSYIYATADCPEVYFLTRTLNPTPTLFDFFDDPVGREARVLRAIDEHGVRVVVVNRVAQFSGPPSRTLLDSLQARFPNAATAGRYIVAWRQ